MFTNRCKFLLFTTCLNVFRSMSNVTGSFQSGNKLFNVLKVFIPKNSHIFELLHVHVHAICFLMDYFNLQDSLASI